MDRKKVKIKFVDFSKDFNQQNNTFVDLLNRFCDVEISDSPEILFYSVFGSEHLKYDCVRVFYTGECESCDFNICDYAIGFDYMQYGDRYIRIPLYALFQYAEQYSEVINRKEEYSLDLYNRDFCSFVYSNYNAIPIREQLFKAIDDRAHVSSGGRYLNNIGGPVKDKHEFLKKFKFNIAVENSAFPGYTTEKIMQAFRARTVPIYYGDPCIVREFNPSTFINVSDFVSLDEAARYIKGISDDESLYKQFFDESPVIDGENRYLEELATFLQNIVNQNSNDRYRRPFGTRQTFYEKRTSQFAWYDDKILKKRNRLENTLGKIIKKKTIKR